MERQRAIWLEAAIALPAGISYMKKERSFTLWKDQTSVKLPGCTHTQHTHHTQLRAPSTLFLLASYWYMHFQAPTSKLYWWVGVVVPNHQCWPAQHTLPHHKNSFCICTAAPLTPEVHAEHPQHSAAWKIKGILKLKKIALCDMSKTLLIFLLRINLNPGTNLSSYNQEWLSLPI